MDKLKALVTAEVIRPVLETLSDRVDFEYAGYTLNHDVLPRDELKRRVEDIDILICEYDTIDAEIFDRAKNLKLIICCRGGVKSVIDLKKARERGVTVCNNIGRNAEAVSDMTIGYMLDLTRNITLTANLIKNKVITTDKKSKPDEYKDTVWGLDDNSPFIKYRGESLNHMTLGLVGFGHAGKLVAKKAYAFGMKIMVYDPFISKDAVPSYVNLTDFDNLLKVSDIISLHCVVTSETEDLFKAGEFKKMKNTAYFINTARGDLVDEDALVWALNSGEIAGAAIDVTKKEPISSDCPLLDAKNLIITPHIAGSSYDVQTTGTNMVVKSLEGWLNGGEPDNCVVSGQRSKNE